VSRARPPDQAIPGESAAPLSGVRTLDLSRLLPGPYATRVLADLGAAVDKIEDPGAGDYLRSTPPLVGGVNATFAFLNRGKRSAVIDLKREEGRGALRAIVPRYDVLIESFRPGVMARLGLGYDDLRALHPGLVYCAITGFGQDGPAAGRAGHDLGYLARAGVLASSGPEGGPPHVPGVQMADIAGGGMSAVIGVLAALHARNATGLGRFVDVSMCEGAMALGAFGLTSALAGKSHEGGRGPLNGGLAVYATYATHDGRAMALAALEPKFWSAFCGAVGIECSYEALALGPHQAAWKAKLTELFATRTQAEWIALSEQVDCCLEPVRASSELIDDPQHVARRVFSHSAQLGGLPLPRAPGAPSARAESADAPTAGEHTRAILRDGGLAPGAIEALLASGAAG
jgi:alpha-methylacyl-CoA racemase